MRIAVLTVLCLLFQQMALAAYACPLDAAPPAAMADCHPDAASEAAPSALCQKHCAPDAATAADLRSGGVPMLALPPLAFLLPLLAQARHRPARQDDHGVARAPPPTLGHARLLI